MCAVVLLAGLAARCGNDLTAPSRAEKLKQQQRSRTGSFGGGGGRGPFQPEPFPGETMETRDDDGDNNAVEPNLVARAGHLPVKSQRANSIGKRSARSSMKW